MNDIKEKRFHMRLPIDLYKRIKVQARTELKSVSQWVRDAVQDKLNGGVK